MQFSNMVALLAIVLAVLYWWHAQGIRQAALQACRLYCKEHDLQLLDDTVALSGMGFARDERGRLLCRRLFVFEFTATGTGRHGGRLVMLGRRTRAIELEPYRI